MAVAIRTVYSRAGCLVLLALLLTGCAYRHQQPAPISFIISDEACHPTVVLTRCRQADPHSCHKTTIHYTQGCEQLQLK